MLRSRLDTVFASVWVVVGILSYHQEDPPSQDQIDQLYKFNDFSTFNFSSCSAGWDQDNMARISQMEEVKLKS